MKKPVLLVLLLVISAHLSFSATSTTLQDEAAALLAQKQAAAPRPASTSACSFTFTSGSGDTFQKFCVTANGNIAQIETPKGHEHIAVGTVGEGYGICEVVPQTRYFDFAGFGDSGNWGPPSLISQSSTSVTIARTTTDGIWTLTQIISQIAGTSPAVRITMALKNNSNIDRVVTIVRYADVDADGVVLNNVDMTFDSAFIWNSNLTNHPFGLMLQNFTKGAVFQPLTQPTSAPPDVCNLVTNLSLLTNTDGSMAMFYVMNVPKGTSRTVTVSYTGL